MIMRNDSERRRSRTVGRQIRWAGLVVMTVILLGGLSWATDALKIQSLVENPESYKMKLVRVEGTVVGHQMNHFVGSVTKLEKCTQRFLVKDETGMIPAVYTTLCPTGAIILHNGDHVA